MKITIAVLLFIGSAAFATAASSESNFKSKAVERLAQMKAKTLAQITALHEGEEHDETISGD